MYGDRGLFHVSSGPIVTSRKQHGVSNHLQHSCVFNNLFRIQKLTLFLAHHSDVIMSAMASQINGVSFVYSAVYSGADKKTSKLRGTGLCEGNSLVTGEFPVQRGSNAENDSIWWRHHIFVRWIYGFQ